MSKMDIKELREMLEGLEILAVSGSKIAKDGKINMEDLSVLIDLLSKFNKIRDGFKGLSNIPAELKDLNEDEAKEIVSRVFKIVKEVNAVV